VFAQVLLGRLASVEMAATAIRLWPRVSSRDRTPVSSHGRFPRLTPTRALVTVAVVVIAATLLIVGGHNEWVVGITAGVLVSVGSTLGVRWRNQDAEKLGRESAP
jgi:hypothetical protein